MQQGSEKWHQFRAKRIGSSDAPVIMGVSPYKSIYDLWLEKKEKKKPVDVDKFITEKGHAYEDLARLDLEKHTGLVWVPEVFVHQKNDRVISSVDGFNEEKLLLWECKYVGKEKFSAFQNQFLSLRERVSEQYYPQLIHHCYTTGGSKGWFTMVVDHQVFKTIPKGEQRFFHLQFELSDEDFDYMDNVYVPRLNEFLVMLDSEEFPMIESTDFIAVNDSRLEELIFRYKGLHKAVTNYGKELEEIKEKIFDIAFQYNNRVIVDGAKISLSESKPKKFVDYELLIKENPGILEGVEVDNYRRHKLGRKTKRITIEKSS